MAWFCGFMRQMPITRKINYVLEFLIFISRDRLELVEHMETRSRMNVDPIRAISASMKAESWDTPFGLQYRMRGNGETPKRDSHGCWLQSSSSSTRMMCPDTPSHNTPQNEDLCGHYTSRLAEELTLWHSEVQLMPGDCSASNTNWRNFHQQTSVASSDCGRRKICYILEILDQGSE